MAEIGQASAGPSAPVTPSAAPGPTIFLREEGNTQSVIPPRRDHSPTLRELAELYNISSVLECDSQGNVHPRAVAFDSPSDVLHSGRHYIARRDARCEQGESRVTFRAKITVKEYELERPTPQSSIDSATCVQVGVGVGGGGGSIASDSVHATPCASTDGRDDTARAESKSRPNMTLSQHNELPCPTPPAPIPHIEDTQQQQQQAADRSSLLATPRCQPSTNEAASEGKENMETVSRPLYLASTERKRVRGDEDEEEHVKAVSEAATVKTNILLNADAAPRQPPLQLHFTPFFVDPQPGGSDDAKVYVTLDYLRILCADVASQEAEFAQRHERAEEVIAAARLRLHAVATDKTAGRDTMDGGGCRDGTVPS